MKKEIYLDSYSLKEALANDPRIILLNELEKKMNNDDSVMALAYQKDIASSRYGDMLTIYSNEEVDEVKNARDELIKAKSLLYMHPLVKEYLDAFQAVRSIYQNINKNIFALMDTDMCPQEEE
ncbi:MAG TPA: YlbF family regulator [Bacilli bacterium]|nr:YlbF family regulator [Bacilli bacterium]